MFIKNFGIKLLSIKIFLFILNSFFLIDKTFCLKAVQSNEYDLFKSLFTNYSKAIRPVQNWNDVLDVNVNVVLKKIASVIENHQTINVYVQLEMAWNDASLVWNPKDFGNLDSVILPANQIWIPDLHLFNSANEDDRIYPLNVEIFSNGTVKSYPVNHLYAHCDFDFRRFPYDIQKCDFLIGSMIDSDKISINVKTYAYASKLIPNSEWSFISLSESTKSQFNIAGSYVGVKEAFSFDWIAHRFTLTIKRSSSFYVNLFIWPLIFILFITMSIFILPPSCVERASMGSLLLLTLVIMSLMLESYTPKSSSDMSIIAKLIGFNMFMVTWSTVVSTLVLSIDKDNFVFRNIPQWLKNIMVNIIGKIVCKHETMHSILNGNQIRDEDIEILDTNQILQQQNRQQNQEAENNNLVNTASISSPTSSSTANSLNLDLSQAQTLLVLINNQLAMMRIRLQEKDLREKNKKEWFLIASALDRFCLIIYFVIMLLGLFVTFVF